MEPITVCCPSCGWTARIAADLEGKKVRCKPCQTVFKAEAAQPPEGPLPQAIPLPATPPRPAEPAAPKQPAAPAPDPAALSRSALGFVQQVYRFYVTNRRRLLQRCAE